MQGIFEKMRYLHETVIYLKYVLTSGMVSLYGFVAPGNLRRHFHLQFLNSIILQERSLRKSRCCSVCEVALTCRIRFEVLAAVKMLMLVFWVEQRLGL
jgi:hypothetical protein